MRINNFLWAQVQIMYFLYKYKRLLLTILVLAFLSGCNKNAFDGLQDGESSNNAEELVKAGNARLSTGDNKGALDAFNRALGVKKDYPPALRGKASAVLNLGSPSGSFAADFSQLIISSQGSGGATDLASSVNFSLAAWQDLDSASTEAKTLLDTIAAGDRTSIDSINISILGIMRIMSKFMIAKAQIEALGGSAISGISSDFSNLGEFICLDSTAQTCTADQISGDDALTLINDAIASGNVSAISSLTGDGKTDIGGTVTGQLETMRCELCFPSACSGATPPAYCSYSTPTDCGAQADSPECTTTP